MRKFLCTEDPATLAFYFILSAILVAEVYWIGSWTMIAVFGVGICVIGFLLGLGYLLYRIIKWAQTHCV